MTPTPTLERDNTYAINSLMQHNLRLVQFLLDLGDAARIVCVLVVVQIVLQRREGNIAVVLGGLDGG